MYCAVRADTHGVSPLFSLKKRFTMRVKVSKRGIPRRRKDNGNFWAGGLVTTVKIVVVCEL